MESMTGYSFIENKTKQFKFTVEIKSLNSKYFELEINLPKFLRQEENEYSRIMREKVSRGKITVTVDVSDYVDKKSVLIDSEMIKSYNSELSALAKKIGGGREFSLDVLIGIEGALKYTRFTMTDESKKVLKDTFVKSVDNLILMRKKEGKALAADIAKSLGVIEKCVVSVKKLAAGETKKKFERLKERLKKITDENIDESRLYAEAAILADKIDINEELVRLKDHIIKFKDSMRGAEFAGKTMDFIAQEMFREINTIGSKTSNSEISHLCVQVKNHIDKIREQSRNIV